MRKTGIILFVIALLFHSRLQAQSEPARQKTFLIKRLIELNHYSPKPVDDSFSTSLFRTTTNFLDPKRLLFLSSEYQQLSVYSLKLDDELKGVGWNFLNLLASLYKKAMVRADSLNGAVFQKPLDFTLNESVTISSEKSYNFAANANDLQMRWRRYAKFIAIEDIYDMISDDSTKTFSLEEINKLEPRAREKIRISEKRTIKEVLDQLNGSEDFLLDIYLNALATCFDPHTNYFSPEGKEMFQSSLSTEGLSFGLELDENEKGNIVIEHLVPGGPAWKSGELHKGDQLLHLQWENKEQMDISSLSLEEVYEMLETPTEERIIIKVKKANGTTPVVTLRKEKISNEENIVKSFVLKGEKKIGYIVLPGFYTEWENESGSGCANDVAKEIIKLKRDNIDGLVVDVRFNGGGSIQEGLEMTGIFIDEGPLAAQKESNGRVFYYRDPNRGVIFNGPLALLVNGQSASASEMLAASLQDYHRAVIIGSNTYGKATVQQLFPLDSSHKPNTRLPNNTKEILKITLGKFYRLDGQSAQLKGVKPDVLLPDAFDELDIGEKFYPNALPSDTVKKNTFYKPLPALPVEELARRSADRINANNDFQNIKKLVAAQSRIGQSKTEIIPLKWDSFKSWIGQHELDLDIIGAEVSNKASKLVADNNQHDKQWLENNPYEKEINKKWLENISADIYIREAFLVLCDLINLQRPSSKN